jgi:hypothetical protein
VCRKRDFLQLVGKQAISEEEIVEVIKEMRLTCSQNEKKEIQL